MKTAKKKIVKHKKTILKVTDYVEKNEPIASICMGYPGPCGEHLGVKFTSTIDLAGRGMMINYTKPDGTEGCYKIDLIPKIKSIIEVDIHESKKK